MVKTSRNLNEVLSSASKSASYNMILQVSWARYWNRKINIFSYD